MNKDKNTKQKKDLSGGFTLLGTLFSAFLAIIVIAAIAALSLQVYGSSRNSKNRFIAVGLAKEGIELVRNIRDGNWAHYASIGTAQVPIKLMKWRGDGTALSSVFSADNLRDLCNGTFTVDALANSFGLTADPNALEKKLKISDTTIRGGFYQYANGPDSIFSRSIEISGVGNCGEEVNSDLSTLPAPTPPASIIVKSTVRWEEPVGSPHSVVLQETLYDWVMQKP